MFGLVPRRSKISALGFPGGFEDLEQTWLPGTIESSRDIKVQIETTLAEALTAAQNAKSLHGFERSKSLSS